MAPDEQQQSQSRQQSLQGLLANRNVLILAGIAGLALIAACVLGTLLWLESRSDDGAAVTPTPFASGPDGALEEPLVVGIDGNSTISVTLDIPTSLTVNGRQFPVEPDVITADRVWAPTITDEETAVWVYGTIVNYVVGLRANDDHQELLEQLEPGDPIQLTTRGGSTHTFTFNSRQTVTNTERDIFAQNIPGITLLLLGADEPERLVVNGRYQVSEAESDANNVINLGETTQIDNLQITVPSASYVPDRPEAPPGFDFFLIDYQIQNVGLTAFDTSQLQFTLIDNLGNQYAVSAAASQIGNYPNLTGAINAGQTVNATAGYQIPVGLNSDSLTWVVSRQDTNTQIRVIIPFAGSRSTVAQSTDVTLAQAEVSEDLTSLVLTGQITNLGNQPVVVSQTDLELTTADGASYLLLSSNPRLPWTVPPGQTIQFAVTYQRPSAPTAVFTILGRPFQLSGLR